MEKGNAKTKSTIITTITVNDLMQRNYTYNLTEPEGKNFDPRFKPDLTPAEMLALGVFGGKYMTDCRDEFPADWFVDPKTGKQTAKLCPTPAPTLTRPTKHDPALNYFGINASQPLSVWRAKGWIYKDDPRGWFQWYCRYYRGRRIPEEDDRQIRRWLALSRHIAQLKKNCRAGDISCRRRQRQALLHWAYDSRRM